MSHILDINSWEAESGGSRVPNQPGEYISVLQHLTTLHEALVQSLLAAEKRILGYPGIHSKTPPQKKESKLPVPRRQQQQTGKPCDLFPE